MDREDPFKSKKFRYSLIALVVICIFLFIFVLAKLVAVNSQCVNDPFVYAAKTIVTTTEDLGLENEVPKPLCSCSLGESEFYFNHEGTYRSNPTPSLIEIKE